MYTQNKHALSTCIQVVLLTLKKIQNPSSLHHASNIYGRNGQGSTVAGLRTLAKGQECGHKLSLVSQGVYLASSSSPTQKNDCEIKSGRGLGTRLVFILFWRHLVYNVNQQKYYFARVSILDSCLDLVMQCLQCFFRAFRGEIPPLSLNSSPPKQQQTSCFFFGYSPHFLFTQKQFPLQDYISRKNPECLLTLIGICVPIT